MADFKQTALAPSASEADDEELRKWHAWIQSAVRAFLSPDGQSVEKPTQFRVASHHWLLALNKSVHLIYGQGLERYAGLDTFQRVQQILGNKTPACLTPSATPDPADEGSWLALPIDQCGIGLCGCSFMKHVLGLQVQEVYDASHRAHNDVKLGFFRAGVYSVVLMTAVPFSIYYGPWQDAAWWRQAQGAAAEFVKQADPLTDPLFLAFLPAIAREMGEADRVSDPAFAREVFNGILSSRAVETKGPRLQLCRWMAWRHCFLFWDKVWSLRALIFVYWGISLGYIDGSFSAKSLRLKALVPDKASTSQCTMREMKQRVSQVRDEAKNQMHVATLLLCLPGLHQKCRILAKTSEAICNWHSAQSSGVRSVDSSRSWFLEQARGEGVASLVGTWRVLSDMGDLQYMQFIVQRGDLPLHFLTASANDTESHPQVLEEDQWAQLCFKVCCCLVAQRLRSLLWYMEGPGLLALFLGGDADTKAAMGLLKMYSAALVSASTHATATIKKQVNVSFLETPVLKRCLKLCGDLGFESVPPGVLRGVRTLFASGATKLIEDTNQRYRRVETMEQKSQVVSNTRLWVTPIQSAVMSSVHKYEVADHTKYQPRAERLPRRVHKRMFNPSSVQPELPLRAIRGSNRVATWPTYNAAGIARQFANTALWCHCEDSPGDWDLVERLWINNLLSCGMVVRKKSAGADQWLISLGSVEGGPALGWKCEVAKVAGCTYVRPLLDLGSSPPYLWLVCLDPECWECLPIQYVSPLHMLLGAELAAEGSSSKSSSSSARAASTLKGCWGKATGEACTLFQGAALQCFPDFPHALLLKLAGAMGVDVVTGCTTFSVLHSLIRYAWPSVSDDEVLRILSKRYAKDESLSEELLSEPAVRECFSEADLKEVEAFQKKQADLPNKPSAQELLDFRAAVAAGRATGAAGQVSKTKKRKTQDARLPPEPQASKLALEDCTAFCPEGCKLYKSVWDNRWKISVPLHGMISRSWILYGEKKALAKCLAWAWHVTERAGGKPCPFEWIASEPWQTTK
jgi:hypothetical protein